MTLAQLTELIVQPVKSCLSVCVRVLTRVAQIITATRTHRPMMNSDHERKLAQSDLLHWVYRSSC